MRRKGRRSKWERWSRNLMELANSPCRSLQLLMKAKFIAYGNRLNKKNLFQWEVAKLNLPGSETYDPKLPWVTKVRTDGNLGCEVYIYVDSGQIVGHTEFTCWEVAKRSCSVCVLLGIQDASRERTGRHFTQDHEQELLSTRGWEWWQLSQRKSDGRQ